MKTLLIAYLPTTMTESKISLTIPPPEGACAPYFVPHKMLLGPGPTNIAPSVLEAMSQRPLGYIDTTFLKVMSDIQELLRYAFQTKNETTLAISGSGSAAMEAAISNVVEKGDIVCVGVIGHFGRRLADMAGRYGAEVRVAEKEWGSVFTLEEIRAMLETHRPSLLCLVYAETSSGALQPLSEVGNLCREYDCLLLVDAVTALATSPLFVDDWKIDICYSCSQKGLSCSSGASPLTLNDRAMAKVTSRKSSVPNWYLDLSMLMKYWAGATRVYHHTPPAAVFYGLREALRLLANEGLDAYWQRHKDTAALLYTELEKLGLKPLIPEKEYRSPAITAVIIPESLETSSFKRVCEEEGVEIGVGLGELAGKVWRIGLMGVNANDQAVRACVKVLTRLIPPK